ncbi:MAG: gliding motility-associated C-terminal domain-containing protein, partial [Saprospiraceae bacterium]|nr:gliding motility-associated C-terminal domain-containing protein [Saprospiraceae bacterium]
MSSPTVADEYEWVIFEDGSNTTLPVAVFTTPVASWPTPVSGVTTNYSVRLRARTDCCGWSTPVYFDFTVAASASGPTATGDVICAGDIATLTATGSGSGDLIFYSDALGQIVLQSTTGVTATYTTDTLLQNTTFYVGEGIAGCPGALTSVDVIVNSLPAAPTAVPAEECDGDDIILEATGSGSGTINFYDDTFAPIGNAAMSAAAPTVTQNEGALAVGTYVYYATEDDGTCESNFTLINAEVFALPAAPIASGVTICSGENVVLTATVTGTANWYTDAGLTNLVATGSSYTTPTLIANTDYYVVQTDANNCESPVTTVTVTVNPLPAAPVAAGTAICSGETATLTATVTGTANWYSDAALTNLIATGSAYVTPA